MGGIGTYNRQLSNLLGSKGHTVTIITFSRKSGYLYAKNQNVVVLKRINLPKISYLFNSFRIFMMIMQLNKHKQIDVIEVPEWGALGFFCTIFRRIFRSLSPIVVRLHTPLIFSRIYNSENLSISDYFRDRCECFSVEFSDAVTCPSKALATTVMSYWGLDKQFVVIPNFIDDHLLNSEYVNNPLKSRKIILFMGNLAMIKGVHVLLEALPLIFEKVDVECHIAGRESSNPILNGLVERIQKNLPTTEYLGFLDGKTKIAEIAQSDVVVIPSLWENFPMVCLEEMALSKLVVASRVGGLPEIITNNENGFLVNPGDAKALANAIKNVLQLDEPEKLRVQSNARKTVENRYASTVVFKILINFYTLLAKQRYARAS